MTAEYLLFNVAVVFFPLVLSVWPPTDFRPFFRPALLACLLVSVPYLVWDALVAGAHWDFNPLYVLGIELAGLPIEEILFFFTVPFACLYTWIILIEGEIGGTRPGLWIAYPLAFAALPVGAAALSLGKGYTGLMLIALGCAAALDRALRTNLMHKPRFWVLMGVVVAFTLAFNGYLTARPVVTYGEQYQLGFRVFTIPIEDFGYGASLVYAVLVVFTFLTRPDGPMPVPARQHRADYLALRKGADRAR